MPIVAQSPPITVGGALAGTFTFQGEEKEAAAVAPTYRQLYTPAIPEKKGVKTVMTPEVKRFVDDHIKFIEDVNRQDTCFTREIFPRMADEDFEAHTKVSISDRYLVKSGETYCSFKAVNRLAQAMKRLGETVTI